jgi:hypothetical protein
MWPFVMPATLLALMAGVAGTLTWLHAMIFLLEGLALAIAWQGGKDPLLDRAIHTIEGQFPVWPMLVLGMIVAIGGALTSLFGAWQMSKPFAFPAADLVVPALLGPILVIPLWAGETAHAHSHDPASSTTSAVGVVLLNLCFLLPIVILITLWKTGSPMVYSWLSWRVDTVSLLLLGFFLLPPALGRWRLGHAEGITLIGFYLVYLLMGIVVAVKV